MTDISFRYQVYYFDRTLALIVMRYIEPPHLILRKALIRGDRLSTLANDMADFMARNLFFTSALHLSGPEKRDKVGNSGDL
jgi:5-methylthioribose kinase